MWLTVSLNGCVPVWRATFINATQEELQVKLVGAGTEVALSTFRVLPGKPHTVDMPFVNAQVNNSAGQRLFEQRIPPLDPSHRYSKLYDQFLGGDFVAIYLLVTEHGIYPIPWQYRQHWQDRLDDILAPSQANDR